MAKGTPIVLDFSQIGQLLVPSGPNLPIPLPYCTTLDVVYEKSPSNSDPDVMDLYAYVRFGPQQCVITDSDAQGNKRSLHFSLRVRQATLEIREIENIKIKRSSVLGFEADTKSVTITRNTEVDKKLAKGKKGSMSGGIGSKISLTADGSISGDENISHNFISMAKSESIDKLVHFSPSGPQNYSWLMLPELLNFGENSIVQALDGVYSSKKEKLLQFKKSGGHPTLLFGIRTDISNLHFHFDSHEDNGWWDAHSTESGFRDKSLVASEMLREYLRKSIDLSSPTNDEVFLAIAAAQSDEF